MALVREMPTRNPVRVPLGVNTIPATTAKTRKPTTSTASPVITDITGGEESRRRVRAVNMA
jgi:hypothetical protein